MHTHQQGHMSVDQAIETLGIKPHEYDMRVKFHECFACGAPMNYLRLHDQHKLYCAKHDDARGDIAEAIQLLNHP